MERIKRSWNKTPKPVRVPIVAVAGSLIILAGIAMLALPGPGWAAIFLGLAVLSTEFEAADKIKRWLIARFKSAYNSLRNKK